MEEDQGNFSWKNNYEKFMQGNLSWWIEFNLKCSQDSSSLIFLRIQGWLLENIPTENHLDNK